MWIGFRHVSAQSYLAAAVCNHYRKMGSERGVVIIRYQDRERIGAHKSKRGRLIFGPIEFGNVHLPDLRT